MPIPHSTYRLQLRPDFDFDDAAAVADYLARLGISHLYASPYLQAAPGSTHGYDVVDPTRVNEELGGEAGHERLQRSLGEAGLGQVLDIVPNHMAIGGRENRWWWDVLRNGPASRFASFFDVDWDPPESRLRNHVLIPVLGDHYGRELEAGDIRLEFDDDEGFRVRYHDHVLPVAPRSLGSILEGAADAARRGAGAPGAAAARPGGPLRGGDTTSGGAHTSGEQTPSGGAHTPVEHPLVGSADSEVEDLAFVGRALGDLAEPGVAEGAARRRRQRDLEALDRRVAALLGRNESLRQAVYAELEAVNGNADRLDAVLRSQNYRLAYWRVAGQELVHRRFFDIDTLAALRTEDPEVFEAVHGRVLEWLRAGVLDGVRVDHPDGLRRPGEYFRRIRDAAPDAWVVAEKILMPDEALPDWPVAGTTGYEVLNDVLGLFVDPAGEAPLTGLWMGLTGDGRDFHDVAYDARRDVLRDVLAADVNRLGNIFVHLCEERRRYRDFTRPELKRALAEVAASFPVYRAYLGEASPEAEREEVAGERDRAVIDAAVDAARSRSEARGGELDPELLDFLRAILVGEVQDDEARGLRMRFQQLTGPVAAKGEEDTAFYRYHRLSALNEVGGDPGRWGLSPSSFHERMARRSREQPEAMSALSTHDTKRSEDVRARLVALSEVPGAWADAVTRWRARNAKHWPDGVEPDPAMEYLLYQTMVGAWPIDEERVAAYMEKATREAKLRTSWTDPNAGYDQALRGFIAALYDSRFGDEVASFVAPLIGPGRVNSLAQKLVQLTAPGVPDIYQGTELWDLSLVDPDNRRAVDFGARAGSLEVLGERSDGDVDVEGILAGMDEGIPKLWVVRQALAARARYAAAFAGGYEGLAAVGAAAEHVVAFVRRGSGADGGGRERALVVVPRLTIRLARSGGWRGTALRVPEGEWTNVMTGETVRGGAVEVASLLGRFPVALLVKEVA